MTTQPLVFVSYSHRDEAEKNDLLAYLDHLARDGFVAACHDQPGSDPAEWESRIEQGVTSAGVLVLLITANYLNSRFVLQPWFAELLLRRQAEGLRIFSMLTRPCAWRVVDWLREFDVLPVDDTPVWSQRGSYLDDYLSEIAATIDDSVAADVEKALREAEAAAAGYAAVSTQRKVLVIDKEQQWARRLAWLLEEIDCRVVAISHSAQVARALSDQRFDAIIIDPNLEQQPGKTDYLTLIPQIRDLTGKQTPIIILSSAANLEPLQLAFDDTHIFELFQKTKLDYQELQETVDRAISSTQTRRLVEQERLRLPKPLSPRLQNRVPLYDKNG